MLEHHADAARAGLLRAMQADRLAFPQDAAFAGLQQPIEHLHEGGFPRPVLAQQRMDFAAADVEIDMIDRGELAKALGDAGQRHQRRGDAHRSALLARQGVRTVAPVVRRDSRSRWACWACDNG